MNSIDNLTDLQAGSRVLYGSGDAEFTLQYSAIVMKPFKGEVVDAIVDKVGKVGTMSNDLPLLSTDIDSALPARILCVSRTYANFRVHLCKRHFLFSDKLSSFRSCQTEMVWLLGDDSFSIGTS